jgi:DNA-binding PadR family transcriptional regulator
MVYRDNSLIPTEAIRLCALGELAHGPRHYAELAQSVRHFVQRITGPSLELLGPSLELLRIEGLIEPVDGQGIADNALLRLTDTGRETLVKLLTAGIRAQANDFAKLVIALKLRFLDLLEPEARLNEVERLSEVHERERARLIDLRRAQAGEPSPLVDWLDLEIAQVEARLAWFQDLARRLQPLAKRISAA